MSQEFISYYQNLTESQKKEFLLAPHIIGTLLAAEDGDLDEQESKVLDNTFVKEIGMIDDSMKVIIQNSDFYQIYEAINEEAAKTSPLGTPEFWQKKIQLFIQLLGRVAAVSQGLPAESLKKYKQFILEIMFKVASASGGGLLGTGQKINDYELNWMRISCNQFSITVEDMLLFLQRKNF